MRILKCIDVKHEEAVQIVVTGSRGKSSVVRFLFAALSACGLRTWARITGVIPRELSPSGERAILRSSGGHVEEMRWWLSSIPSEAEAIVMENSAVAPDLQRLAAQWMGKDALLVLTNVRPDHQDAWGAGEIGAVRALSGGIPKGATVFTPENTARSLSLLTALEEKGCHVHIAPPVFSSSSPEWVNENLSIVLAILSYLGLNEKKGEEAVRSLPPDIADFKVLSFDGSQLAVAFSANDIETTIRLFNTLQWPMEGTTVLFNNRRDRPERLKAFLPWLQKKQWKRSLLMGDRPFKSHLLYREVLSVDALKCLIKEEGRVFGCGNVAGVPLQLLIEGKQGEDHA
ncbi:Mur ligase family protein [Aminobacterium mobile]|jgi:poly-gamma-glutamate synthase PgsB/CapB|uniref:Mur ligase family protein n=1 Tax=Aminobacterium mobile TaxID=81467 RepID=UPI0012EB8904|nr:Mur ligase family protein [Aminobacterium mobile]